MKAKPKVKGNYIMKKIIALALAAVFVLSFAACAKQNGQWDNSKRSTASEEQIRMFRQLIEPHEPAYTNLLAMSDSVQRTYTLFYLDAKSDKTRQTRMEKIIDRLNKNLKPM